MSILPCNNLQHGGVWKRESGRALWQAVSSQKWCCHTQLHPRMPQMWPADSICEGEWQDTKHAQEARWKDMSQNKLGHQIKPAASFEASHRQTTQLGQQNHGTTAKNPGFRRQWMRKSQTPPKSEPKTTKNATKPEAENGRNVAYGTL